MALLLQSSLIQSEHILMMTILLNRIGLVVSMEYTTASCLSGWQWWEACRNLLLVALLGPIELLGLRLVSSAPFPALLPPALRGLTSPLQGLE